MLADISNVDAIYIVCGRTDMRKSIDGLCAIIQEQFSMEIDHSPFNSVEFMHKFFHLTKQFFPNYRISSIERK